MTRACRNYATLNTRLIPKTKLILGFDAIYEAFDASTATPEPDPPVRALWRVFPVPT